MFTTRRLVSSAVKANLAQRRLFSSSLAARTSMYTDQHEWINKNGKFGISEYAQDKLGEIIHLELKLEVCIIV